MSGLLSKGMMTLSLGRADSRRNLGFEVTEDGRRRARFVLTREQVKYLRNFLTDQLRRLDR